MATRHFCLFLTAIGPCGMAWGSAGATGFQLPEGDLDACRARLARRHPDATEVAPTGEQAAWVAAIIALIATGTADLDPIRLDATGVPEGDCAVYRIARSIRPGSTMTYGQVAKAVGPGTNPRFVGQALGRNPWPIVVPCHRVLAAQGGTGGFSARGGVETKLRLLQIERAVLPGGPTLFDGEPGFGLSIAPDSRYRQDPRRW